MIEKITDQNLERYDSRLKEWCDKKFFEKGNYGKYQTTEEAGAVAFYPAPNTPLEGKVKFSFKETPPASGEKGPENPSTISGVDSLFVGQESENYASVANLRPGVTDVFTVDSDGWAMLDYTNSQPYGSNLNSNIVHLQYSCLPNTELDPNKTYVATFYLDEISQSFLTTPPSYHSGVAWFLIVGGDTSSSQIALQNSISFNPRDYSLGYYSGSVVFTGTVDPTKLLKVTFSCRAQTVTHCRFRVSVVEVSNTYTANLGNTYYGGSVDLSTGVMKVTHVVVEPDASTVDISSAPAALPLDYADTYGRMITSADGTSLSVGSAGGTVVYKLATPQILQLSPTEILSLTQADKYTPRLNTIYTDADSVQISYLKSPIRDEYEKTQAILSLGGNS